MVRSLQVISQEGRRLVHIQDENIQVTVVVKIAECATSTRVGRRNSRAGICDLFKGAIPEVSKENARRLVGVLRKLLFDLGIDASSYEEDVRPPIVIKIGDSCSPTGEANLNAELRLQSPIVKIAGSIVAV